MDMEQHDSEDSIGVKQVTATNSFSHENFSRFFGKENVLGRKTWRIIVGPQFM
jgi:hypothetical protein